MKAVAEDNFPWAGSVESDYYLVMDAEYYEIMQKIQAASDFDWLFTEHSNTLEALSNR